MSNSAADLLLGPIAWGQLAYYLFAWCAFGAVIALGVVGWQIFKELE